ncbi:alpha/beta fold hydrolase [Flavobacteriaceae bacterium R38]|nr:alpha/beta fold hydrolase [Flavobacteriaceae bacterium R38]
MKKLAALLLILCIQNNIFSQNKEATYPFEVKIKGQGKPIILIPGLACNGEVWEETVRSLQNNYQCHIFTLAGFSNQEPINLDNGYLPIIEKDIQKYIQNELNDKPIVIGHSLGGFLAMSLASHHSDLLDKIVIVDSYPFMPAAYNSNATEENIVPQAKMMKEMVFSIPDSIYAKQQKITMGTMMNDSENIELATRWSLESSKETIAQAMYELMTTDLREEVTTIKIPTLVLGSWYGAKDYGVTKEMVKKNFENQFQNARFSNVQIADTAKHFIMWDEPNWFFEKVKTFITNE